MKKVKVDNMSVAFQFICVVICFSDYGILYIHAQ